MTEPLLVVGAGMIGRAVARRARTAGHHVVVVDPSPPAAGLLPPDVDVLPTAAEELEQLPSVPVVVWAAGVLAPRLAERPELAEEAESAFATFLDRLGAAPPRRLVLVSSLAVYGRHEHPDESAPVEPASAYGRHKARLESIAASWGRDRQVDVVVARCCGVVGPVREPGGGWMQSSLSAFVRGGARDATLMDPLRGQELLHADDVARLVLHVATSRRPVPPLVNVGSGVVLSRGPGAPPPQGLDWTLARQQLGYRPRHSTIREIMQAIMQDHTTDGTTRSASPDGGARPRTLVLAGSHRVGAYSTALARAVQERLEARGHEVDLVEVARLDLPLHDPADHRDPEGSADPRVRELAGRVRAATSFVWITPIYHGSYTSGFKNALDNVNIALMEGKPVAVMSHGGGRFGGSVLDHLRTIVVNLHGQVLNTGVATNGDDFVQGEDGPVLRSDVIEARLERVVAEILAAERVAAG